MNARRKRLQADYEQIKQGLREHPTISIRGVSGTPPERYQIQYRVRSLMESADGQVRERPEHVAEIYLTLAYPAQAPQCRMLTPVFHPNIAPHAVCIGDHWAAGESLLSLIVRIGEMLAFQSYNTKSPLNGSAARGVDEHVELLPTDSQDLSPRQWADADGEALEQGQCQNCRARDRELVDCVGGHSVCSDCLIRCGRCGRQYCVLCRLQTCEVCQRLVCEQCRAPCPQCGRVVCAQHLQSCAVCGTTGCPDCIIECSKCGVRVCLEHVGQCAVCRRPLCREHATACAACGRPLCEEHVATCDVCGRVVCGDCLFECAVCGTKVCPEHVRQCAACRQVLCAQHSFTCSECGRSFCSQHFDVSASLCAECAAPPQPPQPPQQTEEQAGREEQPPKCRIHCSSCNVRLRVPAEHLGKRAKCPRCHATIVLK